MGTATDIGRVVEEPFNVDLGPFEAALKQEDSREGFHVDDIGAYQRLKGKDYDLGVGLTVSRTVVFSVMDTGSNEELVGKVNLAITGKKGSDTYPLHLTNNVWLDGKKLTEKIGQGPYTVVVKPA